MAAANVSLGNGNLINLLRFTVDVGNGTVGGRNVSSVGRRWEGEEAEMQLRRRSVGLLDGGVGAGLL